MLLIRKHGAVLQAWACLALVVHMHLHVKRPKAGFFPSKAIKPSWN